MFKHLFIILLTGLTISFGWTEEVAPVKLDNNQIFKATVIHVFEDFTNQGQPPQRIAKVRISGTQANKELSLVEVSGDIKVNQGEEIIISQIQRSDTFGLGDSFESKYTFLDYARDSIIYLLLGSLVIVILCINRYVWLPAIAVGGNIFLLAVLLPLCNYFKLPEWVFIVFFVGTNIYLLRYLYPTRKYWLGLAAALGGLIVAGLAYWGIVYQLHLDESAWIIHSSPYTIITTPSPSVTVTAFIIMALFTYVITTLFFVRVSSQYHLLDALRLGIVKLSAIYLFLGTGLLLPTATFFTSHGLDSLYLFNYPPFAMLAIKIIVLFWGNVISLASYVLFVYVYRRKFPHSPVFTRRQIFPHGVTLEHILSDRRVARYHPEPQATKAKAKPSRLKREHRKRI